MQRRVGHGSILLDEIQPNLQTHWHNPIRSTTCVRVPTHMQSNPSNSRQRRGIISLLYRNLFSILNWRMQSMTWITASSKGRSVVSYALLTSNDSLKIWRQSWKCTDTVYLTSSAVTTRIILKITITWPNPNPIHKMSVRIRPNPIHGRIQSMSNSDAAAL